VLYFKDFASGAMIENIVRRAKKLAVKREIAEKGRGYAPRTSPNRSDRSTARTRPPEHDEPDDWARVSGKEGERIIFIRTLVNREETDVLGGRSIQHVGTGQYL